MTAASPAAARAAGIFGSCASDHFLNPLVGLLIEILMTGILFLNRTKQYMGMTSNVDAGIFVIRRK
jgi:hypothetical protein